MMRPVNDEEQKKLYSGKRKCHTKKNLIVIQQSKRIEYLSPTVDGTNDILRPEQAPGYRSPETT